MKKKVLITGASGFVGYHLIEEALQNNLDVYVAVRKTSQVSHLKDLNIQYTYPDLGDIISLKKELQEKQYDYIIHAAAVTRARSQDEYNEINAEYTYNLAAAAKTADINLKGFVFISSLAATGPLQSLNGVITEETIPEPITAYGRSKLLAEEKLKSVGGLHYTILRPTAVYGPRDTGIYVFFQQLKKGIEPYIGKAAQKLSFIYVKDLARITLKSMYMCNRQTYNIADGNFYDKYELGGIAKNVLNLRAAKFHLPVNFVKIMAAVNEKVSSLGNKAAILNTDKLKELTAANWACDIEHAKQDLGFYPAYDLKKGLTETLLWYKQNKWL
jgi:nucleoside-diphosphate-sugar epimerase